MFEAVDEHIFRDAHLRERSGRCQRIGLGCSGPIDLARLPPLPCEIANTLTLEKPRLFTASYDTHCIERTSGQKFEAVSRGQSQSEWAGSACKWGGSPAARDIIVSQHGSVEGQSLVEILQSYFFSHSATIRCSVPSCFISANFASMAASKSVLSPHTAMA